VVCGILRTVTVPTLEFHPVYVIWKGREFQSQGRDDI
jgi:hypothetical protein